MNFNGISGAYLVGSNSTLVFANITLKGFAETSAYRFNPNNPFILPGTRFSGIWPTINLAPNATVSVAQCLKMLQVVKARITSSINVKELM